MCSERLPKSPITLTCAVSSSSSSAYFSYSQTDGFVNVPALLPLAQRFSPDSLLARWFGDCSTQKLSAEQTFVGYGRRLLARAVSLAEAPGGARCARKGKA
jgi:hypothetical protein